MKQYVCRKIVRSDPDPKLNGCFHWAIWDSKANAEVPNVVVASRQSGRTKAHDLNMGYAKLADLQARGY